MLRAGAVAALNLADRPLANRRPLRRAVVALWTLASVAWLLVAVVVTRHLMSSSAGNERLSELDTQIEQEVAELRRLERTLRDLDLGDQNRHVVFLNQKIAQRTFPWSRLFDQLSDVLPEGVRLQSLRPAVSEDEEEAAEGSARERRPRASERRASTPTRWVSLQIAGEAENDEAILELVDALFRHPAFSGPNLRNEAQERSGYRFNLGVRYLPDLVPAEGGEGGAAETHLDADEVGATGAAAVGGAR